MRHLTFSEQPAYPIVLLVPTIQATNIQMAYVSPHKLNTDELLVLDLHYNQEKKKTPVAEMKAYITEELVPVLHDMGAEYLVVTDSEYFKVLTQTVKTETNLGYVLDCVFGPWKVIYVPSHRQVFYDPEKVKAKITQGFDALKAHRAGTYRPPGNDIIKDANYLTHVKQIEQWLEDLIFMNVPLSCDIETFSLKHPTAGIGTITFCWDKHSGIAFPVDLGSHPARVRTLLKSFFERFTAKILWHSISFDVYVLIYQLFMEDILDTEGLLYGLEVMLRNWDDTKLITYLATNSCSGNKLSLKVQAQEFAGNWAKEEIKDIRTIPLPELLEYNLVDGLSTWFTYEKHWDTLVADDQLDIYENLFKPAIVDIIQMQLTGLPVNMDEVVRVKAVLLADYEVALKAILSSRLVEYNVFRQNERWVEMKNTTLKKKRVTLADAHETFNPNSGPQLQDLLYEQIGLPVIAHTDAKQPSTKNEVLKDLKNHTTDPEVLQLLDLLQDYATVSIILDTFVPALEGAVQGPDGWHYLFGNFNLGGTLSGRLSSSDPNLQNLPAAADPSSMKGRYGKLIKQCVQAPPGWLLMGLDFNALEDRISAVTTKDPQKLKVYTDGYDGHCLRAYAYYGEDMPDIDPSSVESINSIEKKYSPLRKKSKNPTFTLTYQGTWRTLVVKYKFTEELAKKVEARYHALYVVSDQWVADKLDEAARVGYITAAFGLRVRTPLLHQVIRGTSKTPYEAEAEGRSAGNALGQSWCLLNSRAWVEFMGKVRTSSFRTSIRPCAQIHDAGYALVKDHMAAVLFMNKHLVKAVEWQEHPEIAHDDVKLGGELSLFHPNWSQEIGIPNGATEDEIYTIIDKKFHPQKQQAAAA